MPSQSTFTARVAEYFKTHPHEWINAYDLERIGGRFAWRSRVSDCRLQFGMVIENRQQRQTDAQGRRWCLSEYKYVPKAEPEQMDLKRSA